MVRVDLDVDYQPQRTSVQYCRGCPVLLGDTIKSIRNVGITFTELMPPLTVLNTLNSTDGKPPQY